MILRKPYAFLIKNFKLIHALITVLIGLLMYKTYSVLSFYGDYINSTVHLITFDDFSNIYGNWIFIYSFISIILSIVLLITMVFKKKPFVLYVLNIFFVSYIFIVVLISKSVTFELTKSLIDIRSLKLIRDLLMIGFLSLIYPLIKNFIRAVGFDIKKFDFKKDLEDIIITEKDNEEFELDVSVDTNKVKRGVNSKTRLSKYLYYENKFVINLVVAISILIISIVSIISVINIGGKNIMNNEFPVDNFLFDVTNVFVTQKDTENKIIDALGNNYSLVVIKTKIKSNNGNEIQFKTANLELNIGNNIYRHTELFRDYLLDLGQTYNGELINNDEVYKLFVFEIPNKLIKKKMKLKFIDSVQFKGNKLIPSYISIPLSIEYIDEDIKNNESIFNSKIEMNNSSLSGSILNINSIDISKYFKVNYDTTYNSNCYEYIYAPLETNYDRDLIKFEGSIEYDSNVSTVFNNLNNLISNYGKITYIIGDIKKNISLKNQIQPFIAKSETRLFYTVPKEIEQASSIKFELNVRNYNYIYTVK